MGIRFATSTLTLSSRLTKSNSQPYYIKERKFGVVSKVLYKVIPNLFRNPNPLKMRSWNKFRMTFREHIYTF